MSKEKEIKYGPNERLIIKNSDKQIDIYLSRKGEEKHDHIWIDKEDRKVGARLDRSFHVEPNDHTGCFLTTACVEYAGLADDCKELQVMRNFRDTYVRNLDNGSGILAEYYTAAPLIVQRIRSAPNSNEVLGSLFHQLQVVVDLLDAERVSEAWQISKQTFDLLKQEYLH